MSIRLSFLFRTATCKLPAQFCNNCIQLKRFFVSGDFPWIIDQWCYSCMKAPLLPVLAVSWCTSTKLYFNPVDKSVPTPLLAHLNGNLASTEVALKFAVCIQRQLNFPRCAAIIPFPQRKPQVVWVAVKSCSVKLKIGASCSWRCCCYQQFANSAKDEINAV